MEDGQEGLRQGREDRRAQAARAQAQAQGRPLSEDRPAAPTAPADHVYHYAGLEYWGPYRAETIAALLAPVSLAPDHVAIDVGCGAGSLLAAVRARFGCQVVGVDRSSAALTQARRRLDVAGPDARLLHQAASETPPPPGAFQLVSWLGGPYLGSDFDQTLTALRRWLAPGGWLLVGQCFWQAPPPAEYLAATGLDPAEFGQRQTVLDRARELGLRPYLSLASSRREWDLFEGTIMGNVERYAADHPDDPDPAGRLEQRRGWYLAQQRWGRDCLGFGLDLLRLS